MSEDVKASTTDALRIQAHRASIERQGQADLRDLELKRRDELERTQTAMASEKAKFEKDYSVQISEEAERLEDALTQQRAANTERIAQEKRAQDAEFEKLRGNHQVRVNEYRLKTEKELAQIRKDLQVSTEKLYEQARKSQRKQPASEA